MTYSIHKGLQYSSAADHLTLDIVIPEGAALPVPCIMVIQGGGFQGRDGQRFLPFAEHLAEHGLAAALVAYRGQPEHTYPTTIADLKAAVRFVRTSCSQYGICPHRIGAMGRSAGATLAALLGVTGSDDSFAGEGGHPGVSSAVQAVVGISGVYDFVTRFSDADQVAMQPKVEQKRLTNSAWVGLPFSPTAPDWLRASPVTHLSPETPPTLLIHSKDDAAVPWLQSRDMHRAMTTAGLHCQLEIHDEGGHAGPDSAKTSMVTFFQAILQV